MARTLEYALAAATRLESFCRFLSFAGPRSGAASGGWTRGRRPRADAMRIFPFVLAFAAGVLVTLQIGSNVRLKEAVGGALPAVIMSSLLGLALLIAVMFTARQSLPVIEQDRAVCGRDPP